MKVAVSGAHRTGKSTLVDDLRRALPGYDAIEEPYRLLEEAGHAFRQPPNLEDFEAQLEASIESVQGASRNTLFDRCPADMVAYIATHREREAFDSDLWLPRAGEAMGRLDLIVFVAIEHPDRIIFSAEDRPQWRRRVDEELRGILLNEDPWGLSGRVLEVRGGTRERVDQVIQRLRSEQQP